MIKAIMAEKKLQFSKKCDPKKKWFSAFLNQKIMSSQSILLKAIVFVFHLIVLWTLEHL